MEECFKLQLSGCCESQEQTSPPDILQRQMDQPTPSTQHSFSCFSLSLFLPLSWICIHKLQLPEESLDTRDRGQAERLSQDERHFHPPLPQGGWLCTEFPTPAPL